MVGVSRSLTSPWKLLRRAAIVAGVVCEFVSLLGGHKLFEIGDTAVFHGVYLFNTHGLGCSTPCYYSLTPGCSSLSMFCNGIERLTVGAFWMIIVIAVISFALSRAIPVLDWTLVGLHAATLCLATVQAFVIGGNWQDVLPIWWSWGLILYLAAFLLFVVSALLGRTNTLRGKPGRSTTGPPGTPESPADATVRASA